MPRRPRLELPGVPLHVTHRGVNRAAVFLDDEDHATYRQFLREALAEHGIALHAYVLMTNHVHLLLTAPAPGRLSRAMSRLGQRYVPLFNRKHGRTGTLWEGRFKSCVVDSSGYLARVHRYIELNPVRAAMVADPEHYRWSSVHASVGTASDSLLTPHPAFLAIASDPAERGRLHRQWLREALHDDELRAIRIHLQQERALGSPRFQEMVEKTLNRPVAVRPRGRPPSTPADFIERA
ncbi:MAG: transposase [Proteobacteria bacterium]|nr:transposase [Pseudomonadota bacterium]MBS0464189.1 transposase [Pseudomonadota bacterium]